MRPQFAQELLDLRLDDVTVTVKLRTCRAEDYIAQYARDVPPKTLNYTPSRKVK